MQSNVAQLPLHDKVWAWFEANKKQTIYATLIVAGVGLIVWFLIWQRDEKQVAAGNALSNVSASQLEIAGPRSSAADAYLKVASEYPKSIAGARALLMAAASFFTDGKYSDAQAQFERFTREYPGSPFTGQAMLGIAACFEAQGKTEQAIAAYKELVTRHPNEAVIPQAKFSLARLYEAQNKPEQARDLYEDVERAAPFTAFGNEAGVRMEELIAKYPNLAPAPSVPTNAPLQLQKK
jgi:TolA-binding protein